MECSAPIGRAHSMSSRRSSGAEPRNLWRHGLHHGGRELGIISNDVIKGIRMKKAFAAALAASVMALPALAAEHIVVVERPVGETTVDLGAKGDSVGDLLVFANKVYDASNKTPLGSDHGYCVRIVVGKSWECFWTLILKEGQITVEGPFTDVGDSLLVITGGSGKYAGARGSLKLHPRDATPTGYDFTYDLL
jgi:allene oxide cyclase